MDIATSLGLAAGIGVIGLVILMGGDLHMFVSEHAAMLIFGGCTAATLIRFPLSSIMYGVPLGARFAFTMRRST
jgi:chemotaxis protein MotA